MELTLVTFDNPLGLAKPGGLYSQVARTNPGKAVELLFVGGQVAVDSSGAVVGVGDIAIQTRQTFVNIDVALRSAGASWSDVLQFNTFILQGQDLAAFLHSRAAVFQEYYPSGQYPPNTLVIVSGLVQAEFLLEIQCVAAIGK